MSEQATPARRGGAWRNTIWGELVSEFMGTFVLIAFGCGSVAMIVAALNESGRGGAAFIGPADWVLICFGWGLAVALGVYTAGGISGAHINPAVTLGFAVGAGFPWKKVPGYMLAQLAGAFVGGLLIYINFAAAINAYEVAKNITRGTQDSIAGYSIFATFPAPYYSGYVGPFISEVIGTFFLVLGVFALVDTRNVAPLSNIGPLLIGLLVTAIGLSFGANTGFAINPARDLGPRIVAWIFGWGDVAIPGVYGSLHFYFWLPIIAPLVGGVIGALVYNFLIRDVLMAREEPKPPGEEESGQAIIEEGTEAQNE